MLNVYVQFYCCLNYLKLRLKQDLKHITASKNRFLATSGCKTVSPRKIKISGIRHRPKNSFMGRPPDKDTFSGVRHAYKLNFLRLPYMESAKKYMGSAKKIHYRTPCEKVTFSHCFSFFFALLVLLRSLSLSGQTNILWNSKFVFDCFHYSLLEK
jgi:hypothetical protein